MIEQCVSGRPGITHCTIPLLHTLCPLVVHNNTLNTLNIYSVIRFYIIITTFSNYITHSLLQMEYVISLFTAKEGITTKKHGLELTRMEVTFVRGYGNFEVIEQGEIHKPIHLPNILVKISGK